ncbi:MAG: 3-phenylpropionate/cinnamic acid dioxygenase subunit beta [Alphaproteobacteria bacterium]|nr:3-phenylpropionate/cinnamic acid dioxygenase subunit beta [Alphaproteobacteria bacterium]
MAANGLQFEVEQFLYREARILSEGRFDEWLDLLTEDITYWMPARETIQGRRVVGDDTDLLPIFEDDKAFLNARVERLRSSLAHAEQPRSRLRYFITNVEVEAAGKKEFDIRCNLLVYQSRLERSETIYAGRREDRLRRVGKALKIAGRKIMLDQTLIPRTISIFF